MNNNIYVKIKNQKNNGEYRHPTVKTNSILIHQLIMDFPDYSQRLFVDHINRNTLDNRKENLRIVNDKMSVKNRDFDGIGHKKRKDNSSGYTGVYWSKTDQKWNAYIQYNKKQYNLGYFNDIEDAVARRLEAEKNYFGKIVSVDNPEKFLKG